MKKVKFDKKLSLNKETIARLNENQMNVLRGGDTCLSNSGVQICTRSTPRETCAADTVAVPK